QGTFRVPAVKPGRESVELRASELAMLLDGIDLRSLRRVERSTR
ncbi:MAG: Orf2 like protein, partial [Planctomycetota bacterium]